MSRTQSTMLPLGTPLPCFELEIVSRATSGRKEATNNVERFNSNNLLPKPLLIMFLCAHCPFVKHIESAITQIDQEYENRLQILAVSSNSLITHPQDGPEFLSIQARNNGWSFPYLIDTDQSFAKLLKAACTPDFFVFSEPHQGKYLLRYRGQLDDSHPGNNIVPSGFDLRNALDAVLTFQKVFLLLGVLKQKLVHP